MLLNIIAQQLDELDYTYNDDDYFPNSENYDNYSYHESQLMDDNIIQSKVLVYEIKSIKNMIEERFNIQIKSKHPKDIKKIYDLLVAKRLYNISEIISHYITENKYELYSEYVDTISRDELDKIINIYDESKEITVIKQSLSYIVSDALKKDLTEYMENEKLSFYNNMIESLDDIPPYELMVSTVYGDDLHYIVNICENVRIILNKKGENKYDKAL